MSAGGYVDGCGFVPVSNGTGDFVVSTAVQGYQTPASAGAVNATVYTYRAESSNKSEWEIGFGAYTVAGTTLARTTVLASSTGAKVSFTAPPNVFVTAAKADLQNASLLNAGLVSPTVGGTGVSNPAAHTIPINEGASAQANTGTGTAGQVLVSGGASADPSFKSGAPVLLETLTANNTATTLSSTVSWSGYSEIDIIFDNVIGATNAISLVLLLHKSGAYQTTNYSGQAYTVANSTSLVLVNSSTNIPLCNTGSLTNTGAGMSGWVRIHNPNQAAGNHAVLGHTNYNSSGTPFNWTISSAQSTAALIDGVQLQSSSGFLAAGTMRIYGRV